MRTAEKAAFVLLVIGMVVKFFDQGGGNMMFMVGATLLASIYYALSFALLNGIRLRSIFKKASYAGTGALRIVGAIGTGIIFSVILIGSMFKFLLLKGAQEMLLIGIMFLTLVLIILMLRRYIGKSPFLQYYHRVVKRGLPLLFAGIFFYLIDPIVLQKIYKQDNPEAIEKQEYTPQQENYNSVDSVDTNK